MLLSGLNCIEFQLCCSNPQHQSPHVRVYQCKHLFTKQLTAINMHGSSVQNAPDSMILSLGCRFFSLQFPTFCYLSGCAPPYMWAYAADPCQNVASNCWDWPSLKGCERPDLEPDLQSHTAQKASSATHRWNAEFRYIELSRDSVWSFERCLKASACFFGGS